MVQQTGHPDVAPSGCVGAITGLVLRCGRGDQAALSSLLDLLYVAVLGKVAPQGPAEDADEQVVEVFREVWRRAPRFEVGRDPVAWVLSLAGEVGEVGGLSPGSPVPAAS